MGSDSNFAVITRTTALTNDNIPGATGILVGDSAFMLTIVDSGTNVTATYPTQIASGLRNAAGFAFHPTIGDLYLQDNGIDGLVNANTARSIGSQIELTWDRGVLQETAEANGPWNDVVDAFSPHLVQPSAPRRFFRTRH